MKAGNDGKLLVEADYFHCGQNKWQKVGLVISNDRSKMTKYRSLALVLINRQVSRLESCPLFILTKGTKDDGGEGGGCDKQTLGSSDI